MSNDAMFALFIVFPIASKIVLLICLSVMREPPRRRPVYRPRPLPVGRPYRNH